MLGTCQIVPWRCLPRVDYYDPALVVCVVSTNCLPTSGDLSCCMYCSPHVDQRGAPTNLSNAAESGSSGIAQECRIPLLSSVNGALSHFFLLYTARPTVTTVLILSEVIHSSLATLLTYCYQQPTMAEQVRYQLPHRINAPRLAAVEPWVVWSIYLTSCLLLKTRGVVVHGPALLE